MDVVPSALVAKLWFVFRSFVATKRSVFPPESELFTLISFAKLAWIGSSVSPIFVGVAETTGLSAATASGRIALIAAAFLSVSADVRETVGVD
ncbi:MAG: hypothetical protein AAFS01_12985 [Pseudomonadota bacterium]